MECQWRFFEIRTDKNTLSLHNLEKDGLYFIQIAAILPVDINSNNASPFSEKLEINLGNITGIVNSNSNLNLKIYPNPTSDYLEVENLTADSDFEIINAAGQKVKIGKLENWKIKTYRTFSYKWTSDRKLFSIVKTTGQSSEIQKITNIKSRSYQYRNKGYVSFKI